VMKLCENEMLNLDAPLEKYVREPLLEGDPRLDLITPRRVLSHTTGLPNWRSDEQPLKISFQPGEKWSYSGEGYYYLQTVVSACAGYTDSQDCKEYEAGMKVCATDFDSYMRRNLLGPFGMASSGYVWKEAFATHMARPYDREGKPLESRKPSGPDVARYGAAGGLLTTARDYARFLVEVMNRNARDRYHLNAESLAEMTRPQVKVADGNGYSVWWGLGWRIVKTGGRELIGHGGENPGFQSISEICLQDQRGFVILINGDNGANLIEAIAPDLSRELHSL